MPPSKPAEGVAIVIAPGGPAPEWNGELDTLKRQPWWQHIHPDHQPHVEQGLRQKHSNWQAGYQRKFTELDAAKRGAMDQAHAAVGSHIEDLQRQLDEERAAHGETKRAANLYTEWFSEDPAHAELKGKHESLQKEHDDLTARFEALQAAHDEHANWRAGREHLDEEARHAQAEAEADSFVEANKDLLEDPDACEVLHHLISTTDMDPNEVAAKVRKLQMAHAPEPAPEPPAPAPVDPPVRPELDPLDVMHQGDSAPGVSSAPKMAKAGVRSEDIWAAAERAHRLHNSGQSRM